MNNNDLFSFFIASLNNSLIKTNGSKYEGDEATPSEEQLTEEQRNLIRDAIGQIDDQEELGFWAKNWEQIVIIIGFSTLFWLIKHNRIIWKTIKKFIIDSMNDTFPCSSSIRNRLISIISQIADNAGDFPGYYPMNDSTILDLLKELIKDSILHGLACFTYIMNFLKNNEVIPQSVKDIILSEEWGRKFREGLNIVLRNILDGLILAAVTAAGYALAAAIFTGITAASPALVSLLFVISLGVWLGIVEEDNSLRRHLEYLEA